MEIENEIIGVQDALTNAQKSASVSDYENAKKILESVIEKLEGSEIYNDSGTEYHTFASPIEQVLFLNTHDKNKQFLVADEAFATLYLTYANLLLGLDDKDGAQKALEKAMVWNPVNPNLRLEYADVFRAKGDTEGFFEKTKEVHKTAYSKIYLGRIYRNIGYYFIEKGLWTEAMAAYVLSLNYDSKSEDAAKEIDFIQDKTDGNTKIPSSEEIKAIAKDHGFSTEPDETIIGTAAFYGHKALDDGRKDVAKYFLSIAYELTADSNIGAILDDINKEDEKISE